VITAIEGGQAKATASFELAGESEESKTFRDEEIAVSAPA
jgi:hypothetical protein